MKKTILFALAACAIGFASCGNKSASTDSSAEDVATIASIDLENATAELAAQLESGDVNKFQEALSAAQAKATDLMESNPEQAKAYMENVQNYLKENTEKISAMIGDNAIAGNAVSTLVKSPAERVLKNLKGMLTRTEETDDEK